MLKLIDPVHEAPSEEANRQLAQYLARERIRQFYAHSWTSIGVNLVLGLILTIALHNKLPWHYLLYWYTSIVAVTGVRTWLIFRFNRSSAGPWKESTWWHLAILGACASGICWGAAGFWFLSQLSTEWQLMLLLTLAGLAAGAVPVLAAVFISYIAFVLPALVPAGLLMALSGNEVGQVIGVMALVYCGAMLLSARNQNRSINEILSLNYRNAQLVNDLKVANRSAHHMNEQLRQGIKEQEKVQEALRISEQRFRDFTDTAADWFYEVNEELRFTYISDRHQSITGWNPEKDILGRTRRELYRNSDKDKDKLARHFADLDAHRPYQIELQSILADGSLGVFQYSGKPIFDAEGNFTGYRGTGRDITDTRRLSDQLTHQANHDELTGLVNRKAFDAVLQELLESRRGATDRHSVLYLDLDQTKVVNDTCGHAAGDELLRLVGATLKRHTRRTDTVARLGGDEFGIVLAHCPLEQAVNVAENIRASVENIRFVWEGASFPTRTSIGVTAVDQATRDVSEVVRAADAACYVAKDKGRNRLHVYHPEDENLIRKHNETRWVARINQALEQDQFELYVQPILPIVTEDPLGQHFEVLLRMRSLDGELVLPGAFLSAAERFNMISALDKWVIRNALDWLRSDHSLCSQIGLCSINISGRSMADDDFLESLVSDCQSGAFATEKLCLEITETSAIANFDAATRFMDALRQYDVRFSLDDFGSGLSSFGYLKKLPVDFLKIDGIFVRDIVDDPIDFAMVRAIHEMGKVVGTKTIAEFVETEAILSKLRELGIDYGQGFHLGAPMPWQQFFELTHEDEAVAS